MAVINVSSRLSIFVFFESTSLDVLFDMKKRAGRIFLFVFVFGFRAHHKNQQHCIKSFVLCVRFQIRNTKNRSSCSCLVRIIESYINFNFTLSRPICKTILSEREKRNVRR